MRTRESIGNMPTSPIFAAPDAPSYLPPSVLRLLRRSGQVISNRLVHVDWLNTNISSVKRSVGYILPGPNISSPPCLSRSTGSRPTETTMASPLSSAFCSCAYIFCSPNAPVIQGPGVEAAALVVPAPRSRGSSTAGPTFPAECDAMGP